MLATRGAMMVSRWRYRCCSSVGRRIDVAPSKRIGIKHPHPPHLLYSLSIGPLTSKEIYPLANSNRHMSRSWTRYFAILSLPQAGHALVIYLPVVIPLLLQRQRNDMDLVTRQLATLVLSAKDVSSASKDCERVVGAREKGGAGDSFECRAERLGGLSEAVGSDGTTFDGGGEDLLGYYETGHCCWVHLGWRWWVEDDRDANRGAVCQAKRRTPVYLCNLLEPISKIFYLSFLVHIISKLRVVDTSMMPITNLVYDTLAE